jgi:hypothetical protein
MLGEWEWLGHVARMFRTGVAKESIYVSHIAYNARNHTEMSGRSKEALRKWKEKRWGHREAIRGC